MSIALYKSIGRIKANKRGTALVRSLCSLDQGRHMEIRMQALPRHRWLKLGNSGTCFSQSKTLTLKLGLQDARKLQLIAWKPFAHILLADSLDF